MSSCAELLFWGRSRASWSTRGSLRIAASCWSWFHFKKMCFTASPFLVLKVVGGVVGVVLGCAHCARRVSSLRFSAIFASGRCIWCYSIVQDGIQRQEQKTKLKNSLIQPRTSQKKLSLFENALRAFRAFPKGKKHQKLRTLGYPPFMEKLIQGQPG